MSLNISRTIISDGIKNGSVVGLDNYGSNEELSSVPLFINYPEILLYSTSVCHILFIVIGIPGNLITICALARYKRIRNAAAILIINLSIADFVVCCAVLPIVACVLLYKSWIFGKTLCRIYPLLLHSVSGVKLFTIVGITINRYILIVHPHMYHRCFNKNNLIIMITAIWISSFVLLMPTLFEVWGRFSLDLRIGFCGIIPDENNSSPKELLMISFFFVPCTIMLLCYIHIFYVVRRVVKKSGANPKSKIVFDNREESSTVSLQLKNETESTETQQALPNDEPNAQENIYEIEPNPMRIKSSNMSKKIRKHLRLKLKQINVKQWFPTRKDKKLRTMIIAIMICFCVCHLPVMVFKTLSLKFSSYPTMVFLSYLLIHSTTCLNPIIYVVMSSEYRKAYKSVIKSLFIKNN